VDGGRLKRAACCKLDRLPIHPPPGYDPVRYEILVRFIEACLANGLGSYGTDWHEIRRIVKVRRQQVSR